MGTVRALYGHCTGIVRALYGHCTGTVQMLAAAQVSHNNSQRPHETHTLMMSTMRSLLFLKHGFANLIQESCELLHGEASRSWHVCKANQVDAPPPSSMFPPSAASRRAQRRFMSPTAGETTDDGKWSAVRRKRFKYADLASRLLSGNFFS